ncbi:MAG: hypothetical protein FJ087_21960, partial [Deltaproteobacteria bacterium]|nr:hypothetical protein [Deltaproteobacteria bacterium]
MGTQALVTFSPEQREMVDVIKTTVYGGGNLSDAELKVYLASCEQVGVHPLAKGVHIWKDQKGRVGLAVSVHTLTALAERDHRAAMVDYEWEFDGDGKDRKILACTCIGEVWDDLTKSWRTRKATVRREDVSHLFAKDNWRDQPFTMWESRARAKWCRTHRADVCGPLYTEDEVEDVRPPRPLAIAPATDVDAATLEAEVVPVAQAAAPAAESPKAEPEPRAAPLARDTPQGRRKVRWAGLCAALAIP